MCPLTSMRTTDSQTVAGFVQHLPKQHISGMGVLIGSILSSGCSQMLQHDPSAVEQKLTYYLGFENTRLWVRVKVRVVCQGQVRG